MSAYCDPADFAFVPALEGAFAGILAELRGLAAGDFVAGPDSLTTVADGYDETGWRYFSLLGGDGDAARCARCPHTARACAAVPGAINAGLSLFLPGTHLFPHRGELRGVLRCHLPLLVPDGDVGLRHGGETRRWQPGRCLIFDDTIEHEAWNHGVGNRVVLLVTFARPTRAVGG
jgi:aspartyl/asparaginyl beta-hydroxylase (cupin superfamily)